jgi:predicted CoA-binding protein
MIDPNLTYAVVWASNNTDKYGYKVFKDLIDKWFNTIAINPKEIEILWKRVYPTLPDYQWTIDIVIFVVPAFITLKILKKMNKKNSESKNRLNIKSIRFQPWSENDDVIQFCKNNNIEYIANACIMIQSNK